MSLNSRYCIAVYKRTGALGSLKRDGQLDEIFDGARAFDDAVARAKRMNADREDKDAVYYEAETAS